MKRIYAIPGLGTTKEIFRELKIQGAQIIVLDWPLPTGNETLKSYAARYVDKIDTSTPFYLMGVSFGGMICAELSEILRPEKTFLISSARTRNDLPLPLRLLKFVPFHCWIGEKALRKINANSSKIVGFDRSFLPEFIAMMNSMPNNYYKYCIHYIVNWDRTTSGKNIVQLHGNADLLLQYKYVKPEHTIDKGTHAMVINNADEISGILKNYL